MSWAVFASFAASCVPPAPAPNETGAEDPVWARVDGRTIRRSEVVSGVALRVYRRRVDLYRLYAEETRRLVDEHVLRFAAAREGLSPEAWLAAQSIAPDDASIARQVEDYLRTRGLGPERRTQVEEYLRERARLTQELARMDRLRAEAKVRILLEPPAPPTVRLEIDPSEWVGPSTAAVQVVTYGSFRDERTRRLAEAAWTAHRQAPDRVAYTHRSVPIGGDEVGLRLTRWTLAAERVGKKSQWIALSLETGVPSTLAEVDGRARRLELDTPARLGDVKEAVERARRLGVVDRASAFVNGTYIDGSFGPEHLSRQIRQALRADEAS